MAGEATASSVEAVEEDAAERRRVRRQTLVQLALDWSPVLAKLTTMALQYLS
ncbi:hypothetical protein [Streptomyces sp. NPDC004042]|uniref:hypothetical protein n=1 Tax=Streptomyces sp. NPDC004042 TaxID=3154451 RepID=UPI0033AEAF57